MAKRSNEQGKAVETAVTDAILRGDYDEAARLAAGHPDPAGHLRLMEQIRDASIQHAKDAGAGHGEPPEIGDETLLAMGAPRQPSRMFELHRKAAKIVSVNLRAEKHGEDTQPAADIKMSSNLDAHAIDAFDPSLRTWLFGKGPDADNDLADQAHDAPNLRQPRIAPQYDWVPRYAGYELTIHDLGISQAGGELRIGACEFNKIRFAPQEGGTVIVSWRLQFHPTEAQAGKLSTLIQETVDVSLLAPEGAAEVDDDADGED